MKYFSLCIVFVSIFAKFSAGQQCSEKGMRQFDANMARLVTIANSGRKLPLSKGAPLKKWCDESERLVKELENYKNKCFKDLAKQVFGVLAYAVKNAMRQYCKRDSKKLTDLIDAAPCIDKNDPVVTKCYTIFIDEVLGAKNAPENKRIPYMCCGYARIFDCFEEKLTDLPSCNEKHVQSISDLVRNIIGNVVDLICGDYVEGSDKCKTLGLGPKKKKSQRRARSFAPPVLDLLVSLPAV